jgi:hypothetical protein
VITPPRSPWSIRRTSTIDIQWPEGPDGPIEMTGRARDLQTRSALDDTTTLAYDQLHTVVEGRATVVELRADPERDELRQLIGVPALSGFRRRVRTELPDDYRAGTTLHLLLDDIPGTTIVSRYALRQWGYLTPSPTGGAPRPDEVFVGRCFGLRPGSPNVNLDGTPVNHINTMETVSLPRADDPMGWHDAVEADGMTMRRARRIDVRFDIDGQVTIDSAFQDSCSMPDGSRSAVHEYTIHATADSRTWEIASLQATPGNLPYDECPMAIPKIAPLVGTGIADLREYIPGTFRGIAGCTHLNDALRALADTPLLAGRLGAAARHADTS